VEGKGYGFAHVSSSQGPKAIFRAVQVLNGTHLKGRNLNIEISDDRAKKAKQEEEEYFGMAQSYGYSPEDLGMDSGRGGFGRGRGGGRGLGRQAPYPMGGRGGMGGGRGGFEEDEYYPMGSHMNKMRGGFGRDQVSLEGPFARGIAGAVSGWANQAKSHKVEQQNKLAEKQAMLFKHSITTLLPMLESGQFSDYKLQCGDEIIDVHKMILAARSPFFVELMMKNPQHCVLTNIDMETLRLLVKFMYTSLVDVSNISPALIIKLLGAAETYQVEMVKEGLEGALMEGIETETVVDYLIIAEELQLVDLKAVALKFIGQRSSEMKQRDDFRLKLKDYPHLMMELFEVATGN